MRGWVVFPNQHAATEAEPFVKPMVVKGEMPRMLAHTCGNWIVTKLLGPSKLVDESKEPILETSSSFG